MTSSFLLNKCPDVHMPDVEKVSAILDDVVSMIIQKMLEYSAKEIQPIHINLREEMALELEKLTLFVSEKVVNDRLNGRSISEVDVIAERDECFSEGGIKKIEQTAENIAKSVWVKLYNERWKRQTESLLVKEKSPKKGKITPKTVEDNHFIPKSFIKRYWSSGQHIFRFSKLENEEYRQDKIGLGQWGFVKNLYSDHLEAYLGLLENDAVKPMEKLLKVEPLNRPERESFIGFIVIQRLRNPHFMDSLRRQMIPVVAAEVGGGKEDGMIYMRSVYESLYRENEFYNRLAKPIMYSKWVVVRSLEPIFILPDTCNIFGKYDGNQYVIMPLTPKDCLIVLPIPVKDIRIIPHYIQTDDALSMDIASVLTASAENEFLADEYFKLYGVREREPNKIIQRIILSIAKITAND